MEHISIPLSSPTIDHLLFDFSSAQNMNSLEPPASSQLHNIFSCPLPSAPILTHSKGGDLVAGVLSGLESE